MHDRAAIRGFSLIEVMFAVFVLALGLLLLGALIPRTIDMQRDAVESTLALPAMDDAEAYIRTRPDLNRVFVGPSTPQTMGFGRVLFNSTGTGINTAFSEDFEWDVGEEIDRATGEMAVPDESRGTQTEVIIPVRDRLWPLVATGTTQPRFVWDFAMRRVPVKEMDPFRVQIAIFVRRVDPNVRVPPGLTLKQLLTDPNPLAVPVAEDTLGRPTLTGVNETGAPWYSRPRTVGAIFDPQFPDRIEVANASKEDLQALMRAGQRVVDNLGNVYTVREALDQNGDPKTSTSGQVFLRVEPSVPSSVPLTGSTNPQPSPTEIHQLLFTPQIPLAVRVVTLDVKDPIENQYGTGVGN